LSRGQKTQPADAPPNRVDVVLIGYLDQGNLGMGYLAAVLQRSGRSVELIDVRDGADEIAARLVDRPPLVIGFSLIFQAFLPQFRRVARKIRAEGITSHFTIGGHFPSLCQEEVLAHFPEIDSIVRYEGEETLLELVDRLKTGATWRDIHGVAYAEAGRVVVTEARALVADLDSLPFPYRPSEADRIGGFLTLPLLASRGCVRRCSFCSIHTFYRTAPGKVVRVRQPAKVIEEMLYLERFHQVRVFLFQDDDFPLWGARGRRWATELANRMHESGLANRTLWKISCRAEYVETELFSMLRDAGLFLVYMGIESGVDAGLDVLFKQMTVEQSLTGVQTLKDLGILFGYGFMLFDPSSSFDSIRDNIKFLRQIVGDGSAAAAFSRMLPYGGTPIRDQLRKEGRLRGSLTDPDYEFLDLRLNEYHKALSSAVRPWIHGEGLSYQLNYAWDELEAVRRLVPGVEGIEPYRAALRSLTRDSNERLFRLVEESSTAFEAGDGMMLDPLVTRAYCGGNVARLVALRNSFIADNIYLLQDASRLDCTSGPVIAPQLH
jgi:anaerobic magnesium-protoporphyrin IX monomethyl ester cyclase